MPNAGIVLDTYKVPIFKENLKNAGFTWKEHPGITDKTKLLVVEFTTKTFNKLEKIIGASNAVSVRRN